MADTSIERRPAETNQPAPGPWGDPGDSGERETWRPPQSAWQRSRLQERNRDDRQEWLRDDFYDDHKDEVELISAATEGVDELTADVCVRTRSVYKDFFDADDLTAYGRWLSELRDEVGQFKTENENQPYQFEGQRFVGTRRYRLPASHRVTGGGAQVAFDAEFGRFTMHYQTEAVGIMVTASLTMPCALVATDTIPRFNAFIKHVRDNARIRFEIAGNPDADT